eukprot:3315813-Karenia_brevis.AAC.1
MSQDGAWCSEWLHLWLFHVIIFNAAMKECVADRRSTARYGLRGVRVGEASHPGPAPGPPSPAPTLLEDGTGHAPGGADTPAAGTFVVAATPPGDAPLQPELAEIGLEDR